MRKLLIGLAAVALFAGACGKDAVRSPEPVDPRAALLESMTSMYGTGTMHAELDITLSTGAEGFSMTGAEDIDLETGDVRATMDLGIAGGTMDMIVADGIIYMRAPMFPDVETEWISFDPSKVDPMAAARFGGFGSGTMDPSQFVGLFAGVVDVKEAGTAEVGGVSTTHYRGTIDLAKVIDGFADVVGKDADPAAKEELKQALLQLKTLGLGKVPFEAWVDGKGLMRRERLAMDFGLIPGAPKGAQMVVTVEFSDFGKPVNVEAPPASDVTDMTKELSGQKSASGGYG